MLISVSGRINSGKDTVGKIIQYLTASDYENVKHILKERNGKDISIEEHFNSFIARDYKVQWEIKKFADKLKDIVCILLNCNRKQLEDESFKSKELGEEWWKIKSTMIHNDKFKTKDIIYYDYKHLSFLNDTIINLDKTQFISMNIEVIKITPRLLLQLLGTDCGRNIIHPNIWVNSLMREYFCVQSDLAPNGIDCPNWIITDMRFLNEMEAVKKRGGITIRVNRNLEESKDQHESETELDNAEFDYVIDNNSDIQSLIEKVKIILEKENIL